MLPRVIGSAFSFSTRSRMREGFAAAIAKNAIALSGRVAPRLGQIV
jgi:hypothetical protein